MSETPKVIDKFPEELHVEAAKDMGPVASKLIEMPPFMREIPSTFIDPNDSVRAIEKQLAERDPNAGPPVVSVGYIPRIV